jgi:hypothetical protein
MPNSQVDVSAGAPNLEHYTDNGDNTTTDNVTGLMWQRTILANDQYTWDNAVGYCKDLTFAGYSDWHLPSEIELLSIVDLGTTTPSISATGFPSTPSNVFWSSTSYGVSGFAWGVEFDKGTAQNYLSTNVPNNARCVR